MEFVVVEAAGAVIYLKASGSQARAYISLERRKADARERALNDFFTCSLTREREKERGETNIMRAHAARWKSERERENCNCNSGTLPLKLNANHNLNYSLSVIKILGSRARGVYYKLIF